MWFSLYFYYFPYICYYYLHYYITAKTNSPFKGVGESWATTHPQSTPSTAPSTYNFPLKSKLKQKITFTKCSNVINERQFNLMLMQFLQVTCLTGIQGRGLNFPGLDMEMLICHQAQAPIVSFWEVQPI